jgi:hypothetical protein
LVKIFDSTLSYTLIRVPPSDRDPEVGSGSLSVEFTVYTCKLRTVLELTFKRISLMDIMVAENYALVP